MPRSVLRVGTRGSALALAQAESIRAAISQVITHRNFELVPVVTAGDSFEGPLPPAGRKTLFTDEIQNALASGKIDLAVHSANTLLAFAPEGIMLAAVPTREDPRDALLTRTGGSMSSLIAGMTIGTSSVSRGPQLLALGRGFVPVPLRGNLDARLRMMSDGEVHALVVALAGLKRMNRGDRAVEILPINVMLPEPGQGALAVECRANDKNMRAGLAQLDDAHARAAFEAERSFAIALAGNRDLPIAALAESDGDRVRLRGLLASADGKQILTDQIEGDDPEKVGLQLAERLRALGADEIIASLL